MKTKILPCTCKHEYQDKKYGRGKRVMNEKARKRKEDPLEYACTVCTPIYYGGTRVNFSGQAR